MIEVKHLRKQYGKFVAVEDLSFSIPKGKIYGFLGPNGAGKSTTMNMITGYLAPSDGEVWIDGINMQLEPEEAKSKLGYLPEMPPLYNDMLVNEYLHFVAELKKIPTDALDDEVEKVIDKVGLHAVEGRLIRNLSKGYRQRVGLAQAILGNPETIILDEPMVGLDPKQILEIRELIKALSKDKTVLLSSHILSEINAICDHIMIINQGKLVASDTPENLEKQFVSKKELQVLIHSSLKTVQDIFYSLKNIEVLTMSEKENGVEVECCLKEEIKDCEALFYLCAQRHAPILQMNMNKASLEDIFLELTEESHA